MENTQFKHTFLVLSWVVHTLQDTVDGVKNQHILGIQLVVLFEYDVGYEKGLIYLYNINEMTISI